MHYGGIFFWNAHNHCVTLFFSIKRFFFDRSKKKRLNCWFPIRRECEWQNLATMYEGGGFIVLRISQIWPPPSLLWNYDARNHGIALSAMQNLTNSIGENATMKVLDDQKTCKFSRPSLPKNYETTPFIVARLCHSHSLLSNSLSFPKGTKGKSM